MPTDLETRIKTAFNTNQEIGCWFLAEWKADKLLVIEPTLSDGREMSVSPIEASIPDMYVEKVHGHPGPYEILSGHFHSRRNGDVVEEYDPYWTVSINDGDFQPGQVIDGKFYVSRKIKKGERRGDSNALEGVSQFAKSRGIVSNKSLFVHPAYGSEGTVMTPELVQITCYELDPNAKFKVKEIAVINI